MVILTSITTVLLSSPTQWFHFVVLDCQAFFNLFHSPYQLCLKVTHCRLRPMEKFTVGLTQILTACISTLQQLCMDFNMSEHFLWDWYLTVSSHFKTAYVQCSQHVSINAIIVISCMLYIIISLFTYIDICACMDGSSAKKTMCCSSSCCMSQ